MEEWTERVDGLIKLAEERLKIEGRECSYMEASVEQSDHAKKYTLARE